MRRLAIAGGVLACALIAALVLERPAGRPGGEATAAAAAAFQRRARPAPSPFAVTRFAVTVTDSSRPTRCTAQGLDRPSRELYVQVAHPTSGRAHPVVVFAHGMRGDPDIMHAEIEAWASKGHVVVVPRFPLARRWATDTPEGWDCGWADIPNQPHDVSFVLDQLAARAGGFAQLPVGTADVARVGVTGISSGGITAFLFFNDCCRDERVRAVATQLAAPLLADRDWRWDAARIPLLMINERDDPMVAYAAARAGFTASRGPSFLFTLPGGPHHSSVLPRLDTPVQVWEVREHLFRWVLHGDDDARSRLLRAFDDVSPERGTWEVRGGCGRGRHARCAAARPSEPRSW